MLCAVTCDFVNDFADLLVLSHGLPVLNFCDAVFWLLYYWRLLLAELQLNPAVRFDAVNPSTAAQFLVVYAENCI